MSNVRSAIHIKGDLAVGQMVIGIAEQEMNKLKNLMALGNINSNKRTIELQDGTIITCVRNFDIQQIQIITPEYYANIEEDEEDCLCFPCFAQAIITKVYINGHVISYEEDLTTDPETYIVLPTDNELRAWAFTYDLFICTGREYILLENFQVKSAGWEEYELNDIVLVSVDKTSSTPSADCCVNDICLSLELTNVNKTDLNQLAIVSVNILGRFS